MLKDLFQEWKKLNTQSIPGYGFYFLDRLYWVLFYCVVGYFGKGNLGAVIISLCVYNLCNIILEGFLACCPQLLRMSKGDRAMESYWISISSTVVFLFLIFTTLMFLLFNFVIYFNLGLNANVKLKAVQFSWLLFPSFLFDGLQKVFQQFLIYRGHTFYVCVSIAVGIVINLLSCIVYIYIFQLGPRGAALSILSSKAIMFLMMIYFCHKQLNFSE
jgi:Na+-driven multidrug efflux pump